MDIVGFINVPDLIGTAAILGFVLGLYLCQRLAKAGYLRGIKKEE